MGVFDGRVAVITGAASGIGRATALAFVREGAAVVLADRDEQGEAVAREIESAGGSGVFVRTDVALPADVERLFAVAEERLGRVDCIFNNAGIEGAQAPIAEATLESWERVIAVNLGGVFFGLRFGIPALLRAGGGAIVNNASVAGLVGVPGLSPYTASKGGIVQLTRTAALEYATQGIRVNCVCPGVIDTPMVRRFTGGAAEAIAGMEAMEPMGRLGRPEEIADAVLYLCSDAASFVTGVALPVDGGFVAR